jgi:hypothetical protein
MPVLSTIDGHTRHGRAAPAQVAALLSYYDAIKKTYYYIFPQKQLHESGKPKTYNNTKEHI